MNYRTGDSPPREEGTVALHCMHYSFLPEEKISLEKMMVYITGLLIGTLTLLLSVVVYIVIWTWFESRNIPSGVEVGFDLRSLLYSPLFWLIAISGFALGFVWTFRRARS